jgi:hypothetical protein
MHWSATRRRWQRPHIGVTWSQLSLDFLHGSHDGRFTKNVSMFNNPKLQSRPSSERLEPQSNDLLCHFVEGSEFGLNPCSANRDSLQWSSAYWRAPWARRADNDLQKSSRRSGKKNNKQVGMEVLRKFCLRKVFHLGLGVSCLRVAKRRLRTMMMFDFQITGHLRKSHQGA